MDRRVAIIGYAQSQHMADMLKTREDMVFDVCKEALFNADILREEIDTVLTASTDFLDGRTIANVFLSMAVGAFLKDESRVEEDGALACYYALMKILSGTADIAMVEAHTMASTFSPHQVAAYTVDPLLDRQVGLMNDISAAAIQARMYMSEYGVSEEHLAMVSVKNLVSAANNPYAHNGMADVTVDEVLESKLYYEPIRELMFSPISDGCCALILAAEEKALEICSNPVWIEGVGTWQDGYMRDRNLKKIGSLEAAANKAYEMAGITDPYNELDVVELTARFSHEEMMMYEALGLCREGKGKVFIEEGVTWMDGEIPVSPSGGAFGADPVCATGLDRMIEAAKQINGEAEGCQIPGASVALAHGQWGPCAQKSIVFVLGGDI